MLVNYPGAVKFITGSGAVWVCQAVLSCLGSRNKSKKCDKQLTHIVRVIFRPGLKVVFLRKIVSADRLIFLLTL